MSLDFLLRRLTMNTFSSLKNKKDQTLISDLKDLVARERQLLTEILHHLREVEVRKLYLERGYSSLWAFATEELGYSESAAQRRIQAMRLLKELPEVEEKIESGRLSLSVASQLQGYLKKADKKSREEQGLEITPKEKLSLVNQLEGTSARQCEEKLAQLDPELSLPKEKIKVLTDENVLIQFIASKRLMKKINRIQELLSHQNKENRYDILIEQILDMALEKIDPVQREARRQKRLLKSKKPKSLPVKEQANPPSLSTSAVTPVKRHIPNKLRDKIFLRDGGRCQFRDKQTGRLCGARHAVQVDHRFPFALGGEHSEGNLRLMCQGHNQNRAEKIFGKQIRE